MDNEFVTSHAALKAKSDAKHEKTCLENHHIFTRFAFDTYGFLASEDVNFLNMVQMILHGNILALGIQNSVFSKTSFAIQKGVVTQLVDDLSTSLP
ncbi:hypothetical protein R6Q59_021370 [Mikania micrantha]